MKKNMPFFLTISLILGVLSFASPQSWDGAYFCHIGNTFLVPAVNADTKGQPGIYDLTDKTDTDDDINFTLPLIADRTIMADETDSASFFFKAMIDFSSNASKKDIGEQIFGDMILVPTRNRLSLLECSAAANCRHFARFHSRSRGISRPVRLASDNNEKNDIVNLPIPIELTAFDSTSGNGVVHLEWIARSEIENLGYHIYRYIDRDVMHGYSYFYRLANVDFNGNIEYHGPISIIISDFPISLKNSTESLLGYLIDYNYSKANDFDSTQISICIK